MTQKTKDISIKRISKKCFNARVRTSEMKNSTKSSGRPRKETKRSILKRIAAIPRIKV